MARYRPLILGALLLVSPLPTRADVVLPPPRDCPRGTTPVTSHGGPTCVADAPKDCPNGWQGALGGQCILAPCTKNEDCGPQQSCVEHSVCLRPVQDDYYDYGEDDREQHGELEPTRLLRSPGLLAGPPPPKKKRPTPITRYEATNLCSPEVPCEAPSTCQREKLCVPTGTRALAYRGTNIGGVRVARKTATPVLSKGDASTERTAPLAPDASPSPSSSPDKLPPAPTTQAEPTEATAPLPRKGGCAGCAVSSSSAPALPWLAILGVALLRLRRARASR
jgi:hypothetical protein